MWLFKQIGNKKSNTLVLLCLLGALLGYLLLTYEPGDDVAAIVLLGLVWTLCYVDDSTRRAEERSLARSDKLALRLDALQYRIEQLDKPREKTNGERPGKQ